MQLVLQSSGNQKRRRACMHPDPYRGSRSRATNNRPSTFLCTAVLFTIAACYLPTGSLQRQASCLAGSHAVSQLTIASPIPTGAAIMDTQQGPQGQQPQAAPAQQPDVAPAQPAAAIFTLPRRGGRPSQAARQPVRGPCAGAQRRLRRRRERGHRPRSERVWPTPSTKCYDIQ